MTIKVYVTTNKVGSKCESTIEIDDDACEKTIEETAREVMFEMIEWGWEPATKDGE